MSGEIELTTWNATSVSGTAVIQMQAGGKYAFLRQEMPWKVDVALKNGQFEPIASNLRLTETPLPAAFDRVSTPLRIVNASSPESWVYKLGYPAKPGLKRKDFDPSLPGVQDDPTTAGDQRADPETPPADWNLKVKAKDK